MRKKPFSQTSLNCHHRITPARAGKTVCPPVEGTTAEDHPRSCGKDHVADFDESIVLGSPRSCGKDCRPFGMLLLPSGSPPLVRERLHAEPQGLARFRITPARAGKTCKGAAHFSQKWDHPRSCGKDRRGCKIR